MVCGFFLEILKVQEEFFLPWVVTELPFYSVLPICGGFTVIIDQDYSNPSEALLIYSEPEEDWVKPEFLTPDSTNQKARISGLLSTSHQFNSIHQFIPISL